MRVYILYCLLPERQSRYSLGFSLGVGRSICGSLKLLKEQCLQEETTTNLLDYVSDLHSKLSVVSKLAQQGDSKKDETLVR